MEIKISIDTFCDGGEQWVIENGEGGEDFRLRYCCDGKECGCYGQPELIITEKGWNLLLDTIAGFKCLSELEDFCESNKLKLEMKTKE